MAEKEQAKRSERVLGASAKLGEMPSRCPQEGVPNRCPQEVPPVEVQPAVEGRLRGPKASSEEEGGGRANVALRDSEGEAHSPPVSPLGNAGGAGPQLDEADDELDGAPVIRADDGEEEEEEEEGEEEEEEEDWNMDMRETQDCAMETARPGGERSELQSEGTQRGAASSLRTAFRSVDVQRPPVADVEMSIAEELAGGWNSRATPLPAMTEPSLGGVRLLQSEPQEALCVSQELEMGDSQGPCVFPPVDIKDEPIDEEYDRALASQPPPRRIKDEPDTSEELVQQHKTPEELRISSVFSVGDNSTSPTGPAALPLTPLSGGARVSALPPRTVRMATPPAPPLARSATPPSAVRVSCSGCTKVLQKGQTAFQRKGSSQLFCSTVCLTGCNLPPAAPKPGHRKTCHYCLKEIGNPKDVIIAPVDMTGTVKDFCSQACLSSFDFKRNSGVANEAAAIKCSMCKKSAVINHEVNYQGAVHKLCSDSCFSRFRSSNNLTMNCCETCAAYCCSATGQCHLLQIEGATKKFCSQSCLATYKQKCIKVTACATCQSLRSVAEMVEGSGPDGKIQLYCSAACANHNTPRSGIAGTSFPCTSCRVLAVPQFHLALNDGSIRNFCSYNCVLNFQAVFSKALPQSQVNGTSAAPEVLSAPPSGVPQPPQASGALPLLSAPSHGHVQPQAPAPVLPPPYVSAPVPPPAYTPCPVLAPPSPAARAYGPALPSASLRGPAPQASPSVAHSPAPQSRTLVKLSCRQCHRHFYFKPELIHFKGQMVVFCGKTCSEEYRKFNFVTARCEYCKLDKMVRDVVKFNHQDRPFCSEGCKLLFKHDLAKRSGSHCRTCAYCTNMAQKMIQNHFGGKLEEFCREECMSLYTVLYYQMAKCDWCQRQGKLLESLKWLGEVKHFCDLPCLLQFSSQNGSHEPPHSEQHASSGAGTLPPHIPTGAAPACIAPLPPPAGVHSATPPFHTYVSKEATPVIANVVSLASAPTGQPYVTANTALQGAVPTALTQAKINGDASTQTDAMKPPAPPRRVLKNKALLCKPISQNKGTLCKPHTHSAESQTDEVKGQKIVVLPVPVPVFIPVPMHLYSQYTPLPLGLPVPLPVPMFLPTSLDSAELITRTIQGTNPLQGKHPITEEEEEEEEEEERDKPLSYGDQGSTYSGDLESEGVSTPHSWEEETAPSSHRLAAPDREESLIIKATPPLLDLEADFPLESLGPSSVKDLNVPPRFRGRRRPRDGFPPRKRVRPASPQPQNPPNLPNPDAL